MTPLWRSAARKPIPSEVSAGRPRFSVRKDMATTSGVGPLLAYWRNRRRMSQLALATEAEVSPRHVSFIESGRSNPSRDMVLLLASVLDVPLRERNRLLAAAGFAAAYRETGLAEPQLAVIATALDAILAQHRPYPAVVLDRHWNITRASSCAERFFAFLLAGQTPPSPPNVLRLIFHAEGLRPHITNWAEVAESLIQRVHREAVGNIVDDELQSLLDEVLAYPGVPSAQPRRPGRKPPADHPGRLRARRPNVSLLLDGDDARHPGGHHGAGDPHRVLLPGRRRHAQGGAGVRRRRLMRGTGRGRATRRRRAC